MNDKNNISNIEINNFELDQMLNKERILLESECAYFENSKYDETNHQYFDYYSDDENFLNQFLENLTNKTISLEQIEGDEQGEHSFEECIKKLIERKYLIEYSGYNSEYIFELLNDSFNLNINKDYFYKMIKEKYDKYDLTKRGLIEELQIIEMCKLLKEKGLGIVYLYSIGDFYCYGVFSIDKIKKLKSLFKTLYDL